VVSEVNLIARKKKKPMRSPLVSTSYAGFRRCGNLNQSLNSKPRQDMSLRGTERSSNLLYAPHS